MNNFFDVAGHGRIVKSLKESIAGGMVSHAYIFYGNRGSGSGSFCKPDAGAQQRPVKGSRAECGKGGQIL